MSVGAALPRLDGPGKLNGTALYVDDFVVPGMLHGATVRTKTARGRIKAIHFDPAFDWNEFVVVTHKDIPGPNEVKFIETDGPVLVAEEFHHAQEPVVLLAHADPELLREAAAAVTLETEPLPAVLDPLQKLSPELIQYKSDNVFKRITIRKGDPESIFKNAPHVLENEYRTGAQEHVYLENNGMIAQYDAEGRLAIMGTMQCPYYVIKSVMHVFGLPEERVRIVQTTTGGGFGGKEDYPSVIALHAALLAHKAGKPVKIIYDRAEDMAATTKRHPSVVRHKTAFDDEGRLLAMDIDVVFDGGAYMTLSPVVLSRGIIHAAGPYRCEHTHVYGEARLTNKPPNGAFRGFGAPQTLFAMERQMDAIAAHLDMDPAEVRRRNLLKKGEQTSTQQIVKDDIELAAWMDEALAMVDYQNKREEYARFNATHPYLRRGIGIATFFHGAGFTGAGEVYLASKAWVEARSDGSVEVLVSNTDIGQGTTTVMTQIACETLGLPAEKVCVAQPDTARVPDSGPTVASRTVMVVGGLVEKACKEILKQLGLNAGGAALSAKIEAWHAAHPGERLVGRAEYQKPESIVWDDVKYVGDAYGTYGWATYIADVEVDLRTCETRVTDFVAQQEVGRVMHPVLAEGQIQGGVAQAIGWALMEDVVEREGAMINNQMTNYIVPVSGDLPPLRVVFIEKGGSFGPGGAKGIGELPMDGPAPAVINAVCQALGTQKLNTIPLMPERLMEALEETDHG